jgi:surface glycoprotein (TIGR04207 family)
MTGNNTSPGEKLRALFLAALMVGSVFAVGVAFTGSAAANANGVTAANQGTVGDSFTATIGLDNSGGETVTVEHIVDGEVVAEFDATDGGANDADGNSDGSIEVELTAGKTAGGQSMVKVTDEAGNEVSDTYDTTNYLVQTSAQSGSGPSLGASDVNADGDVLQGSTETIQGEIYEYPGVLQDDVTLDYSLVYDQNASNTDTESSNDLVLADSDTNSGQFSVERSFDEVDDVFGEEHLNDYPSDLFDAGSNGEPAYKVYVDSASDTDPAANQNPPYSDNTPRVTNNEGNATVDVRLNVTASPDSSPIQYADSVDVSGDVLNADGGLGNYAVKLETPTGVTAKTTDTAQNGAYTYTAVFNDAGEWSFGTDEGGFIDYETLTVEAADADVTLTNDSGNLANFPETYTVTVDDSSGDDIVLNGSDKNEYEGYVALTGEFEASGFGANSGSVQTTATPGDVSGSVTTGTFVRAADLDDDGNADQVHIETNDTGQITVTDIVPVGAETTAELQNDLSFNASAGDPITTNPDDFDLVGGVENYRDAGDTPDFPDFVGEDTNNVQNADPVNILNAEVEDPQDTQITQTSDGASYTDILTDSGPAVVEVLPLADSTTDRIVGPNNDRLGFDLNRNLDGMTAYRAAFELRDIDNNVIAPGDNAGEFDYMIIKGAQIDATVFHDGSGGVDVDSRNGNLLDATYDRTGNNEYEFLLRPTSTDVDAETISHEIKVVDEESVFLNLTAAGLDIEQFEVDGDVVSEVPARTTLDLASVVEAPNDNDAPVNNGRVRLTQTGTTTEVETDARTANINDGTYQFNDFAVADRGIDTGTDNIADDISELVFTAYQYNDSDESNSLDGDEVDRAAVESLDIAPNRSLRVEFLPENTSVYSGFSGDFNTFTLTRGIEYDQIAFKLTFGQDGPPVNLTEGVDGERISGGLGALSDNTDFVSLVGPTGPGQGASSEYSVKFNTTASNPDEGYYVISDIDEGPNNVTSDSGSGLNNDDAFTFPSSVVDQGTDTYELNITTPDANFKENPNTGFINVENPSVDGEIVGVASEDINGVTYGDLSHDTSDVGSFENVSEIETGTIGVDRVYRINATFEDATGTPVSADNFDNIRIARRFAPDPDSYQFSFVDSLGNDLRDPVFGVNEGIQVNNESGSFQYDLEYTSDNNGDGFAQPYFSAWANNQSVGSSAFNQAYEANVTATPTWSNPVVEVYDEQGSDLPTNPSDSSDNAVLANDVTNNLRVEAFPADEDDFVLPDGLEFGFPNDEPFAENIVGTTTSLSDSVITEDFEEGQIGFLAITPTGTGTSILGLTPSANGNDNGAVVDTNGSEIRFDVLRSNLRVNATLSADDIEAGENVTVTLTSQSTGDVISLAGVSLVNPSGNVIAQNQTDAGGQVTFEVPENAADGTYSITTRPAGFEPVDEGQVELSVAGVDDAPTIPGAQGPATDLNGDGLAEDTNGDGQFTLADITFLFNNQASSAVQDNPDLFDFNGNGGFSLSDVTFWFNNQSAFSP